MMIVMMHTEELHDSRASDSTTAIPIRKRAKI
jgi:hypothetical protein